MNQPVKSVVSTTDIAQSVDHMPTVDNPASAGSVFHWPGSFGEVLEVE